VAKKKSLGVLREEALQYEFRLLRRYALGGRCRPVVLGVRENGTCIGDLTVDSMLRLVCEILQDSGRLYRLGDAIVYETDGPEPGGKTLVPLSSQYRPEPQAATLLTNLFVVGVEGEASSSQSLPPVRIIHAALADEELRGQLRRIDHYSRRPCFDDEFRLCRPGWNESSGILLHGPEITPITNALGPDPSGPGALDRLPPRLRQLLVEFAWRSDSDVVNAVAMLLTGLLINHFIIHPHPVAIVDGNSPGVGKTLLVQMVGRLMDGQEPPRIPLGRDDELEKKLGALIRDPRVTIVFLDNARRPIESMILEQNALSPLLCFRRLGASDYLKRRNGLLWFITMNSSAGTTDLLRRSITIRLFHEGDPKRRDFRGDPLTFVSEHRLELLGELAGMVLKWVEGGRVASDHRHRCDRWAATIGGILAANGLGEFFLQNAEEAELEMDAGLLDLTTMAERVLEQGPGELRANAGDAAGDKGKPAAFWHERVVMNTGVLRESLGSTTQRRRATVLGQLLSRFVDRTLFVDAADGRRAVTLRRRNANSRQRLYYFEVAEPSEVDDPQPTATDQCRPGPMESGEREAERPSPPADLQPRNEPAPGKDATGGGDAKLEWC
jgi:hypothetical protein